MEAFCDGAIYAALNEAVISEDKKRTLESAFVDAGVTGVVTPAPAAVVDADATRDAAPNVDAAVSLASEIQDAASTLSEYELYLKKREEAGVQS